MSPDDLTFTPAALDLTWPDGETSTLSAAVLRGAARDATSRRELHDTGRIAVAEGVTITGVDYVGAYGVNIRFSDGHERAIYPFDYLRELAGLTTN